MFVHNIKRNAWVSKRKKWLKPEKRLEAELRFQIYYTVKLRNDRNEITNQSQYSSTFHTIVERVKKAALIEAERIRMYYEKIDQQEVMEVGIWIYRLLFYYREANFFSLATADNVSAIFFIKKLPTKS